MTSGDGQGEEERGVSHPHEGVEGEGSGVIQPLEGFQVIGTPRVETEGFWERFGNKVIVLGFIVGLLGLAFEVAYQVVRQSPFMVFWKKDAGGYAAAYQAAQKDGKPLLVFFMGVGCTNCKEAAKRFLTPRDFWRLPFQRHQVVVDVGKGPAEENLARQFGVLGDVKSNRPAARLIPVLSKAPVGACFLTDYMRPDSLMDAGAWRGQVAARLAETAPEKTPVRCYEDLAAKPAVPQWFSGAGAYQKALNLQAQTGQPVMVYFHTEWCTYCKELESAVLYQESFNAYFGRVIKVTVNPENSGDEAQVESSFGSKGYPSLYVVPAGGAGPKELSLGKVQNRRRYIQPYVLLGMLFE